MKVKTNVLLKYVGIVLGVLALIGLFLPGLSATNGQASMKISLIGVVFGGGPVVTSFFGSTASTKYDGGMSFFALASFIMLIAALVLIVLSLFKKNKNLVLTAGGLLVLSAILMFLLKTAGTNTFVGMAKTPWKEFIDSTNLGIGAILYAVFALLAGGCAIASTVLKK